MSDKTIVVIGGGPAGLQAASAAKRAGAKNVIVIDREEVPGGILNQCIHAGFGLTQFKEELTGPEYADKVLKEALRDGVELKLSTTVIKIDENKTLTTLSERGGVEKIEASAIILCTGCRERARGVIHIPGERPAGIYTAGLAQKFVNIDGHLPGKSVVILGSGDIGLIMARRLTLQGAKVKAVLEARSFVGGLSRNVVQCLQDYDIPLYTSHTVTDIIGKKRVEKVKVARVTEQMRPIQGTEFEIECDTLLLSVGLIPENELAEMAKVNLHPRTNGAIIDEHYMTNQEGIFACGNALHVHDLVDHLAKECIEAGTNAAHYVENGGWEKPSIKVSHDQGLGYILPHTITGKEKVKFQFRVSEPMDELVLHIGDFQKKYKYLQPNIMSQVVVPQSEIEKYKNESEIRVWIEKV